MDIFTLFGSIVLTGFTEAEKQMAKLDDWAKKNKEGLKAIGVIATGMGAAVTAALGYATNAAMDEQVGISRLRVALKAVGADYDALSDQIEANIAATQKKTNYSDGEQRDALVELIGVTGTYEGALEQLQLATDLAANKKMDLVTAATLVGRVVTGNTQALSRYGIVVKEGAKPTEVLAQMQKRFAGAAEGAVKPTTQLKNAVEDVAEMVGGYLVPAMKTGTQWLVNIIGKVKEWGDEHPRLMQVITTGGAILGVFLTGLGGIALTLPKIIEGVISVTKLLHLQAIATKVMTAAQWLLNAAMTANPVGLVIAGVAALTGLIYGLVKGIQWLTGKSKENADATRDLSAADKLYYENVEKARKKVRDLTSEQEQLTEALKKTKESWENNADASGQYKDEVEELKHKLAGASYELSRARDELDDIQAGYDAASDKVKVFEDAIDAANRELEALTNPRLQGMQAYEDQLFDIEQQLRALRLAELSTGADMSAQTEALEKQREMLELRRDITFEPLLRSARETVEGIQGLNEEVNPNSVMTRIAELASMLSPSGSLTAGLSLMKAEQEEQNQKLITQTGLVANLESTAKGYEDRLNEISSILEKHNWQIYQHIQYQLESNRLALRSAQEDLTNLEGQGAPQRYWSQSEIEAYDIKRNEGGFLPPYGYKSWEDYTAGNRLAGFSSGGWINEPTLLTSLKSGRVYGTMAETRPEYISPSGPVADTSTLSQIISAIQRGFEHANIRVMVGSEDVSAIIARDFYSMVGVRR